MTRPEYIEHLQKAIRATHGCESLFLNTVPVKEEFQGKIIWQGDVEVFCLIGHPKSTMCYAWSYDVKDGSRTLAVLDLPPVISPVTAVRAAIVSQIRDAERANQRN